MASWVRNAKALQSDMMRSKAIANDIVRQSEAPDVSGQAIQDAESKAALLNREVQYSQQLSTVLHAIRAVNQLLSEVEAARDERRILDSLRLLERAPPIPGPACAHDALTTPQEPGPPSTKSASAGHAAS